MVRVRALGWRGGVAIASACGALALPPLAEPVRSGVRSEPASVTAIKVAAIAPRKRPATEPPPSGERLAITGVRSLPGELIEVSGVGPRNGRIVIARGGTRIGIALAGSNGAWRFKVRWRPQPGSHRIAIFSRDGQGGEALWDDVRLWVPEGFAPHFDVRFGDFGPGRVGDPAVLRGAELAHAASGVFDTFLHRAAFPEGALKTEPRASYAIPFGADAPGRMAQQSGGGRQAVREARGGRPDDASNTGLEGVRAWLQQSNEIYQRTIVPRLAIGGQTAVAGARPARHPDDRAAVAWAPEGGDAFGGRWLARWFDHARTSYRREIVPRLTGAQPLGFVRATGKVRVADNRGAADASERARLEEQARQAAAARVAEEERLRAERDRRAAVAARRAAEAEAERIAAARRTAAENARRRAEEEARAAEMAAEARRTAARALAEAERRRQEDERARRDEAARRALEAQRAAEAEAARSAQERAEAARAEAEARRAAERARLAEVEAGKAARERAEAEEARRRAERLEKERLAAQRLEEERRERARLAAARAEQEKRAIAERARVERETAAAREKARADAQDEASRREAAQRLEAEAQRQREERLASARAEQERRAIEDRARAEREAAEERRRARFRGEREREDRLRRRDLAALPPRRDPPDLPSRGDRSGGVAAGARRPEEGASVVPDVPVRRPAGPSDGFGGPAQPGTSPRGERRARRVVERRAIPAPSSSSRKIGASAERRSTVHRYRLGRRARGYVGRACGLRAGRRIRPPGIYVVRRGDSLWRISRRHYRLGRRYRVIYRANLRRIRNPHLIFPCQRLYLPHRRR